MKHIQRPTLLQAIYPPPNQLCAQPYFVILFPVSTTIEAILFQTFCLTTHPSETTVHYQSPTRLGDNLLQVCIKNTAGERSANNSANNNANKPYEVKYVYYKYYLNLLHVYSSLPSITS